MVGLFALFLCFCSILVLVVHLVMKGRWVVRSLSADKVSCIGHRTKETNRAWEWPKKET